MLASRLGKDALISEHRANCTPIVTYAAAIRALAIRAKYEATRVARVRRVERCRPVVAPRALITDHIVAAGTCGGEENKIPVRSGELTPIDTIYGSPFCRGVVQHFPNAFGNFLC